MIHFIKRLFEVKGIQIHSCSTICIVIYYSFYWVNCTRTPLSFLKTKLTIMGFKEDCKTIQNANYAFAHNRIIPGFYNANFNAENDQCFCRHTVSRRCIRVTKCATDHCAILLSAPMRALATFRRSKILLVRHETWLWDTIICPTVTVCVIR